MSDYKAIIYIKQIKLIKIIMLNRVIKGGRVVAGVCGVSFFHTHQGRVLHYIDNQYSKYGPGVCSSRSSHASSHTENTTGIKKETRFSMPCPDRRLVILNVQINVVGLLQVTD